MRQCYLSYEIKSKCVRENKIVSEIVYEYDDIKINLIGKLTTSLSKCFGQ